MEGIQIKECSVSIFHGYLKNGKKWNIPDVKVRLARTGLASLGVLGLKMSQFPQHEQVSPQASLLIF